MVTGSQTPTEGQRPEGGPEALRASLKTNTNLTNLTNARKNIRVIAQGASNL